MQDGRVRSTMQDVPLSITRLLEHGSTVHGDSEVATWQGEEARRETFAAAGARAAPLATFMFNGAEHLEAYLGVPAMGAVLHTLNLRLPADQLGWIGRHAEDQVVVVDAAVLGLLAPV